MPICSAVIETPMVPSVVSRIGAASAVTSTEVEAPTLTWALILAVWSMERVNSGVVKVLKPGTLMVTLYGPMGRKRTE